MSNGFLSAPFVWEIWFYFSPFVWLLLLCAFFCISSNITIKIVYRAQSAYIYLNGLFVRSGLLWDRTVIFHIDYRMLCDRFKLLFESLALLKMYSRDSCRRPHRRSPSVACSTVYSPMTHSEHITVHNIFNIKNIWENYSGAQRNNVMCIYYLQSTIHIHSMLEACSYTSVFERIKMVKCCYSWLM